LANRELYSGLNETEIHWVTAQGEMFGVSFLIILTKKLVFLQVMDEIFKKFH